LGHADIENPIDSSFVDDLPAGVVAHERERSARGQTFIGTAAQRSGPHAVLAVWG
jgi:hypothetical protein